jgi:hypothetical protein
MAAVYYRFHSRSDLLRQDQNKRVSSALEEAASSFQGSAAERRALTEAVRQAQRVVDRQTLADKEPFFMLTPSQNTAVVAELLWSSRYPKVATHLWALCIEFVDPSGTGEILFASRETFTGRVGCSARAVAAVLGELVELGALIPLREPEPGKQGRGSVRYFLNPRVGTQGVAKGERSVRVRAAPLLRSIDGSAHPSQRRARAPALSVPAL